jgi:hypothetical protein
MVHYAAGALVERLWFRGSGRDSGEERERHGSFFFLRKRGTGVAAGKEDQSFCVRSSCMEGDKADRW